MVRTGRCAIGVTPGQTMEGGPGDRGSALDDVRGVPNYYGPQRFGMRGDTWEVGRALTLESRAMAPPTSRRRPLRFRLTEVAVDARSDDRGPYLELRFVLPPGCYATAVLRELGKGGIEEAATG